MQPCKLGRMPVAARTIAEQSHGESRRIHMRIAETFEDCVIMIEELMRIVRLTADLDVRF